MAEWKWTQARLIAAQLVAEGKKLAEISQATKLTSATISRWSKETEFKDQVQQIQTEMAEALKRAGLRVKEYRLDKLNGILARIEQIIDGRAESMATVPGGQSGLLVRKRKSIGWGDSCEKVEEYAFDRALVEEFREVLKHAAQEVGEWIDKKEMSGPEGRPIPIEVSAILDKIYGEPEQQADSSG